MRDSQSKIAIHYRQTENTNMPRSTRLILAFPSHASISNNKYIRRGKIFLSLCCLFENPRRREPLVYVQLAFWATRICYAQLTTEKTKQNKLPFAYMQMRVDHKCTHRH